MKSLLFALLLSLPTLALAQTRQPDQYCILETTNRSKGRAALLLSAGTDPAKTGQVEEVQQIANLENEVDALNYLSSRGWEIINVTSLSYSGTVGGARYYLRRRKP
jgi:hypothetical protein